jgi:DNA-binding PadR family transcriptional regulator
MYIVNKHIDNQYIMASKGLMAASTKPLILSILKEGKNYGYNITQRVKEISGGSLQWADGMLYPVLKRLEGDGFITSEWIITEADRRRKYYSITEAGKLELLTEQKNWLKVHAVLAQLWQLKPAI